MRGEKKMDDFLTGYQIDDYYWLYNESAFDETEQ